MWHGHVDRAIRDLERILARLKDSRRLPLSATTVPRCSNLPVILRSDRRRSEISSGCETPQNSGAPWYKVRSSTTAEGDLTGPRPIRQPSRMLSTYWRRRSPACQPPTPGVGFGGGLGRQARRRRCERTETAVAPPGRLSQNLNSEAEIASNSVVPCPWQEALA